MIGYVMSKKENYSLTKEKCYTVKIFKNILGLKAYPRLRPIRQSTNHIGI
jgi:hypothetical protein